MTPSAEHLILARHASDNAGAATPSTLTAGGTGFDVVYSVVPAPANQYAVTRQSRVRAAYLEH